MVGVAIAAREQPTPAMMNIRDGPVLGGDVEDPSRAHGDTSSIRSSLPAACHHRLDKIPRLKSLHPLRRLGSATGEAEAIHQAHLPAAMPRRRDLKRVHASHPEALWRACP